MRTGIVTGLKRTIIAATSLATFGLADNPISSYHYLADPSAASDGETFYILTDTDDMCVSSDPFNYDIVGLYAFTSKDMKNWTDHGLIFRSKREFETYPNNTWASGIAVRNGKVYIVYPDGASGVGMITAPSIDGPYTDPIAESYGGTIRQIAGYYRDGSTYNPIIAIFNGCDDIEHCFDPGIFFDDDGSGYVIFGGGSANYQKRPIGNNFDIVKFTDQDGKITIDKNSLTRIQAPGSFEAPYLHKYNGKYYLSFNNDKQIIDYGISTSITGPYSYEGEVIPAIWQVPGANNRGGNNHQGFAKFKNRWYAVYHDRRLVSASEHPVSCSKSEGCVTDPEPGNHRSVSIDEITWNGDKMVPLTFTNDGPEQIGHFDPYQTYKAITSSKQRNIRSRTDWTKGQPVKHVLTPLASKESWIRVSGVDFGSGATSFIVTAASLTSGNSIEIRSGSPEGTLAGTCELPQTGNNVQDETGWRNYETTECSVTGLSDIVEQLFLVFKGAQDSTMGILEWEFTNGPGEPQKPFNATNTPWSILEKIEAENFDIPGKGKGNDSYKESKSTEDGDSDYRTGTGVDLYKRGSGIVVGYNDEGDWLEYTVTIPEAGDYTFYAAVAADHAGGSFKMSLDGIDITDEIAVPANKEEPIEGEEENYNDYNKVFANVTFSGEQVGEHVLRLTITGVYFDIDYFNFVKGKDAPDNAPIGSQSEGSSSSTSSSVSSSSANSTNVSSSDTANEIGSSSSIAEKDKPEGENSTAIFGEITQFSKKTGEVYNVFDLKGNNLSTFTAKDITDATNLWKNGLVNGSKKANGVYIIRNIRNGKTSKIQKIEK